MYGGQPGSSSEIRVTGCDGKKQVNLPVHSAGYCSSASTGTLRRATRKTCLPAGAAPHSFTVNSASLPRAPVWVPVVFGWAVSQYLRHGQPGIAVKDAPGNASQKRERGNVAAAEGPGGLRRIVLDEAADAVGQVHYEAVGLLLHPADDHQSLAEIALGVARRMGQGTNISFV